MLIRQKNASVSPSARRLSNWVQRLKWDRESCEILAIFSVPLLLDFRASIIMSGMDIKQLTETLNQVVANQARLQVEHDGLNLEHEDV